MSPERRTLESFAVGSIDGGNFCVHMLGSTEGNVTAPVGSGSPYLHVLLFTAQSWDSKRIQASAGALQF